MASWIYISCCPPVRSHPHLADSMVTYLDSAKIDYISPMRAHKARFRIHRFDRFLFSSLQSSSLHYIRPLSMNRGLFPAFLYLCHMACTIPHPFCEHQSRHLLFFRVFYIIPGPSPAPHTFLGHGSSSHQPDASSTFIRSTPSPLPPSRPPCRTRALNRTGRCYTESFYKSDASSRIPLR